MTDAGGAPPRMRYRPTFASAIRGRRGGVASLASCQRDMPAFRDINGGVFNGSVGDCGGRAGR